MRWREDGELRWLEASLPGAEVAFTTRIGGGSSPPFDTLNLGVLTDDDETTVRQNRARLAAALGLDPNRIAIGRQIHEPDIAGHDGPQDPAPYATAGVDPPTVDGHWTRAERLALLVFVADCVPIALSCDGGRGGVAMLHGGWRPLAAGIVDAGVDALDEPDRLHAAIGPGIGPCCFEVGTDVLAAFAGLGPGLSTPSGDDTGDRVLLDLPEVASRLLERRGVTVTERSDLCTRCNPDLFFSHRGQGPSTGRQGGLVWRSA
jgi:YfiH family protein